MATTIRLLALYKGYQRNSIITVDDAVATELLRGGVSATTDLTGGTVAYQADPTLSPAPAPEAPNAQTVRAGRQTTLLVPAGVTIALTGSSDIVGVREVLNQSGGVNYSTPLQAGAGLNAGPYAFDTTVRLSVQAGTLTTRTLTGALAAGATALGPVVDVPAGSTNFVLKTSGNGSLGDTITAIKFIVTGAATTVTLTDGDGTAYPDPSGNPGLIPNPWNNTQILGPNAVAPADYPMYGAASYNGPWKVTTGANVALKVYGNIS